VHNVQDPFYGAYKAVTEIRRRIEKWSDFDFRQKHSQGMSTALCKELGVLKIVWNPWDLPSPWTLPEGHCWDPTPQHVLHLLIMKIFDAWNPEIGLSYVTGDHPDEFNLRKCIAYDAIEWRGPMGTLVEAWRLNLALPALPAEVVAPMSVAPSEGSASEGEEPASSSAAARRVLKRPARPLYVRPKYANGALIDTREKGGPDVKQAAAAALVLLLEHIAKTRASDIVTVDGPRYDSLAHDGDDDNVYYDLLFYLFVLYVFVIHGALLWRVSSGLCRRIAAAFSSRHVNASVQCLLLPDAADLTVVALRRELRSRGLRTTGLRRDLEGRLQESAAAAEK
jgi:hypothetical protein